MDDLTSVNDALFVEAFQAQPSHSHASGREWVFDALAWLALRCPLAGRCYARFSLPVVEFIPIRWYYRRLLWGRFLWRVLRLDLRGREVVALSWWTARGSNPGPPDCETALR